MIWLKANQQNRNQEVKEWSQSLFYFVPQDLNLTVNLAPPISSSFLISRIGWFNPQSQLSHLLLDVLKGHSRTLWLSCWMLCRGVFPLWAKSIKTFSCPPFFWLVTYCLLIAIAAAFSDSAVYNDREFPEWKTQTSYSMKTFTTNLN